ncbi:MAG TPA: serine hydrolase [Ilumatobacteraceae bacterium]|nr:serine hydrolase [Ilumatobacteraceae bacterium]
MNVRSLAATAAAVLALMPCLSGVAAAKEPGGPGRVPPSACPKVDYEELRAPYAFRTALTEKQLETDFVDDVTGLAASGFRPLRLAGYQDHGEVRFATRWVQMAGPPWHVSSGLTLDELTDDYATFKDGFRITDISGFNTPAGVRYNAIWENNAAGVGWRVVFAATAAELEDLSDTYAAQGFAPERVEGYRGADGMLRFVATWISAKKCAARIHASMDEEEYQELFDDYVGMGYRQVHLDATTVGRDMYYHGIWWKQDGPNWGVRIDSDWYLFQRLDNNYWCAGMPATNFYATDNGNSARLGAIWTLSAPNAINDASPLGQQVLEEVNCSPGRAGAAVVNLTTGESVMAHADQIFSMSSTVKPAILLALLRQKVDGEGVSLQTLLELPAQIGGNQGPDLGGPDGGPLQVGNDETLEYLARKMIDDSNNWATNMLIQYVGMDAINDELDDLGLDHTRLNRYMVGTGSPSAHGTSGAAADYEAGWDNVTTPREWTTFLAAVHENDGLLEEDSYDKFWELLGLNGSDDDAVLDAGVGDGIVTVAMKPGSNAWGWDKSVTPWLPTKAIGDFDHRPQIGPHIQRSEGGRMTFDNGQVAVYAVFINEADNPTDDYSPFNNTIDCIMVEAAREYSGQTTGAVLPQCL